jgi:hypothetical protein
MTTYGMDKLGSDLDLYEDPFGYIDQVSFYRNFGQTGGDHVGILAVDKTLGHIKLATGKGIDAVTQATVIQGKTAILDQPQPPDRGYAPRPEGTSGNMKLCMSCSYCPYKKTCWPGVRTFIYSSGPTYLVEVKKLPKVPEVTNG